MLSATTIWEELIWWGRKTGPIIVEYITNISALFSLLGGCMWMDGEQRLSQGLVHVVGIVYIA